MTPLGTGPPPPWQGAPLLSRLRRVQRGCLARTPGWISVRLNGHTPVKAGAMRPIVRKSFRKRLMVELGQRGRYDSLCSLAQPAGFPGFWAITNTHSQACAGPSAGLSVPVSSGGEGLP